MFTQKQMERLYNIQQGDVWGQYVLDQISPGISRNGTHSNDGFSLLDEKKNEGKSSFLKNFLSNQKKPNY